MRGERHGLAVDDGGRAVGRSGGVGCVDSGRFSGIGTARFRFFATSPSLNFVLRIFVDAALPACAVGSCVRVSCSTNSWLCAGMRCMCAGSRGKISFTPPKRSLKRGVRPARVRQGQHLGSVRGLHGIT